MKRGALVFIILAVLVVALPASAQVSATGTLAVSGTLAESIQISLTSGSLTLGGTPQAATVAAGTIQKFGGTLTGGFTQTASTATDYTIGGNFNVKVDYANGASANYTLTGELNSAALSGTTWTLGAVTLNNTTAQNLTTSGTYGSAANYALAIKITNAATGSIANTVNLVATSN